MSVEHLPPQLTPHFSRQELLGHASLNDISPYIAKNLLYLAQRLQTLRDLLGKPIMITSAYRTPAYNQNIGGAPNSYHLFGMAADIVVPGMPAPQVQQWLKHWSGGLGSYPTFTHVDLGPKRRWGP